MYLNCNYNSFAMKNLLILYLFLVNITVAFSQHVVPVFALESNLLENTHWTDLKVIPTQKIPATSNFSKQADRIPDYAAYSKKNLFAEGTNIGSAALAFDGTTQRLFYVSLLSGEIGYRELAANGNATNRSIGNVYLALHNKIPEMGPQNQGVLITRLTSGPDGYIYGLSNDGSLFFRVNASAPNKIESQTFVLNQQAKTSLSFQDKEIGWGGDMIADASGNLYVFSASGNVFRFDKQQKAINHLGKIFGLPLEYSISGAAVQESGAVLISASSGSQSFEMADMKTLRAQLASVSLSAGCGDLASAVFLNEREAEDRTITQQAMEIKAFPNPVTGSLLYVQFQGLNNTESSFQLELMNALGQTQWIQAKTMSQKQNQVSIPMQQLKAGAYYVKVSNKEDFSRVVRIVVP